MSATPDIAVDPKLATKLRARERVWLKRHWRNIASASVVTTAVLFPLLLAARSGGLAGPQGPIAIPVVGFLLLFSVWLWVRALVSRLRFTESAVEATDQNLGLSQHRIRLGDIVAASIASVGLDIHLRSITSSHYCVYACELTPGRAKESRWVALWITPYEVAANTLLAELRHRCELTEVSPVSRDYGTGIWPQPTIWQRSGFDPGRLPAPRW